MASVCDALLKGGVFDTFHLDTYDNLEERYLAHLKTMTEKEARSAADSGVDLTVPTKAGTTIGFGATSSSNDFQRWKSEVDQLDTSSISRMRVVRAFSKIANEKLATEFVRCVGLTTAAKGSGIDISPLTLTGDIITFTVSFPLPGTEPVEALFRSWLVTNATLRSGVNLVDRTIFNNEIYQLTYERLDPEEPVIVTGDTTRGPVFAFLEGSPKPLTKVSARVGGDFGTLATIQLRHTFEFAQTVRVWGGAIGQWRAPNCSASVFVLRNQKQLYGRDSVYMTYVDKFQQPQTYIHGLPFSGTPIGSFDIPIDVAAGETLTIDMVAGSSLHTQIANMLLHFDYQKYA